MVGAVEIGRVEKRQVIDLDELVGLLNYVIEGVTMTPDRPIPWGGISKLVKDINARTARIRQTVDETGTAAAEEHHILPLAEPPPALVPSNSPPASPRVETKDDGEPIVQTEVDKNLQTSSLARRIQMAPRLPAGRVREVPLQEPR
jgi:hypothetical protein